MIEALLWKVCDLITLKMNQELQVDEKSSRKDLVSNVDKEIEKFLIEKLSKLYPHAKFCGEESYQKMNLFEGEVWIIDPIDGTNNFIKQHKNFGMLLAFMKEGELLEGYMVDVLKREMFVAKKGQGLFKNGQPFKVEYNQKLSDSLISMSTDYLCSLDHPQEINHKSFGIRYIGSCCLDGINVVDGSLGAYLVSKSQVWDIAPHLLFCQESGLVALNLDKQEKTLSDDCVFVFGQKEVVLELIDLIV